MFDDMFLWLSLALLAVALVLCFITGIFTDESPHDMSVVDKTSGYIIYRHDETGVYYFSKRGEPAVVMVNPDGTPYTEKGSNNFSSAS